MLENAFNLFLSKNLLIDPGFGLAQLVEYEHKLSLVESGMSLKEVFGSKDSVKIEILENSNSNVVNINPLQVKETINSLQSGSIVSIDLVGFMSVEDGLCSYGALTYSSIIEQLALSQKVIGLRIFSNTGGGESMAGQIWYEAIKGFRETQKPVIGHVLIAGSAGYKAMCGCNEIVAMNEMSYYGSIGTMASFSKQNLDFIRENMIYYYSRNSDEKNKSIRELLKGNSEVIIDELDEVSSIFQNIVKENRPLKGDVENTLKGDMFIYEKAKERGLVDSIGNTNYVVSRIMSYKYNNFN